MASIRRTPEATEHSDDNAEQADLRRIIHMGAAAEFQRRIAHFDDPDNIAVLFAEQRRRAQLLCLVDGQLHRLDVQAVEDQLHDPVVNPLSAPPA